MPSCAGVRREVRRTQTLTISFIASAITAITAVPAGLVSDRIGRNASFILGDGIGAIVALVMIHARSEALLLAGPAFAAFFGNLRHTSEAAFMAESSKPLERIHLFSRLSCQCELLEANA